MRTKHSDGLTPAREVFCAEYIKNGSNAAAAYKVAFPRSLKWHPSTVYEHACLLKQAPAVKARIAELARAITEEAAIDAQAMLREAACIASSDITLLFDEAGELLPMADWPASMRAAVSSIEMIPEYRRGNDECIGYRKKLKLWDKNAALDKIFKHLGLYVEDNRQKLPTPADVAEVIRNYNDLAAKIRSSRPPHTTTPDG